MPSLGEIAKTFAAPHSTPAPTKAMRFTPSTLTLLALLTASSCTSAPFCAPGEAVQETKHANGKISARWCTRTDASGRTLKQGRHETYFPGGEKESSATYVSDEIRGESIEWHANGKLRSKAFYDEPNGVTESIRSTWHDNGAIDRVTHMKGRQIEGISTSWYADGTKRSEWTYRNGIKNGRYTLWETDGRRVFEALYIDGKESTVICIGASCQ